MKNESFWVQLLSHRATSVLIVGAALLSIIFMRQLSELREIAYIFIGVMILFIGMLLVELLSAGGAGITMTYDEIAGPKFDYHLITAFSIIVFSYNVQFLVFPAFSELKNRSNARFAYSSILSVIIETVAYMATALLAILLFGTQGIKPDMLDNMAERPGSMSVILRFVFCILLIFDVPFLFFATKE